MGFFQSSKNKKAVLIKKEHLFDTLYQCSACKAIFRSKEKNCPKCQAQFAKTTVDPVWVDEMSVLDDE